MQNREIYLMRIEELLEQEKVNGYECKTEDRGNNFIPFSFAITVNENGQEVFSENIKVW